MQIVKQFDMAAPDTDLVLKKVDQCYYSKTLTRIFTTKPSHKGQFNLTECLQVAYESEMFSRDFAIMC